MVNPDCPFFEYLFKYIILKDEEYYCRSFLYNYEPQITVHNLFLNFEVLWCP